jgi:hypothetical protein
MKVFEITCGDGSKRLDRLDEVLDLSLSQEQLDMLRSDKQVSIVTEDGPFLIRPTEVFNYYVVAEDCDGEDQSYHITAQTPHEALSIWKKYVIDFEDGLGLHEGDVDWRVIWQLPEEVKVGIVPYLDGLGSDSSYGARDVTEEARAAELEADVAAPSR